ncbi:MAG: DUF4369 domain-containing protein [Gillisia sp.]
MKKFILLFVCAVSILACSEKESNLLVKGNVKGLKKGILYLQRIDDTLLVNVDSMKVNGDANFEFHDFIKSPQIMYLYLQKVDNTDYDDRIEFFAEPGEITINTNLKHFDTEAKIVGSSNEEKLEEYKKMMSRFNDKNLDLIKKNFEAEKDHDEEAIIALDKEYSQLLKRKYLYTVNFAINNKDKDIAPYLALSEVFDANIKYLDTIYNSLTPQVKKSKYGKALKDFLKERRKNEKLEKKVKKED